jgi:hypothetical protein
MMRQLFRRNLLRLPFACLMYHPLVAQRGGATVEGGPKGLRTVASIPPLPRDLKGDRERNLQELTQLAELVTDLREAVEKTDPFVFSVQLIKKSDSMRKLAQKIGDRIRHDYA